MSSQSVLMQPEAMSEKRTLILLTSVFLAVRVGIFLYTHHIHEDAMIFLSYAKNFLPNFSFTFNAAGPAAGPTSYLYVGVLSLIYKVFRDQVWLAITIMNSLIQWLTVILWGRLLFPEDGKARRLLFCAFIFVPVSLLISYTGMEMSLVVLGITCGFWALVKNRPCILMILFLVLPFLRPDTVGFSAILTCLFAVKTRNAKKTLLLFGALFGGLIALSLFNGAIFGAAFNQSMRAKMAAYGMSRTFLEHMMKTIGNYSDVFGIVITKYFNFIGVKILVFLVYMASIVDAIRKPKLRNFGLFSGLVVLGIPTAYAVSVTFPWYLYPSEFFMILSILSAIIPRFVKSSKVLVLLFCGLFFLMTMQVATSISYGFQLHTYLPSIGRYIRDHTPPEARVFLEPAGYIAFYAERYIIDEIGLVYPDVTKYRKSYGSRWHDVFFRENKPDVIVSRTDLTRTDVSRDFPVDVDWFTREYALLRYFSYKEFRAQSNLGRVRRFFVEKGTSADYFIFAKKSGT